MNTRKTLTVFASVAVLVLVLCFLPTVAGQTPAANAANARAAASTSTSMMPMPLVAPLFIEDQERTGVVTMVNSAPQSLDVDVVLYSLSGDQLATQPFTLTPYSQKTVAVADLLQASDVRYGSVFIVPHRMTTMAAQLSISGRNGAVTNDIEEEFQMLMGMNPANFRTASVLKNPVIAVRSLSSSPQTLSLTCLAGNVASTGDISIGPNQTLLIDACGEAGPSAVPALGGNSKNLTRNRKAVAVSLSSSVASQDLAVFGFGTTGNGRVNEFAAIPLTDSNGLKSSTAVFTGVVSAAANSTKLHAAIANFGAEPRQATVAVSAGDGSAPTTVATVQLAPYSVSLADITKALNGAQAEASFTIQTEGVPGEMMSSIQAIGRADGSPSEVTLPWKDRSQSADGGQHPWRIDGNFTSTLTLYNPDLAKGNSVKVMAYAGGIKWVRNVSIPPQGTMAVRLNDIIGQQQPDDTGKMLPSDATTGMVTWFTLTTPRIFGQLVQADASGHAVRPFACAQYYQVCGAQISNLSESVGTNNEISATALTCGTNGDCSCIENCGETGNGTFSDWYSSNSNIASLNDEYGSTAYLQGDAMGSVYTGVTATDGNGCQGSGGGQATVTAGCPMTIAVAARTTLPLQANLDANNNFPNYLTGIGMLSTMVVGPPPYKWDGSMVTESFSSIQTNCPPLALATCSGNATFTVGPPGPGPGTTFGTAYPTLTTNQFFDEHAAVSTLDILSGQSAGYSCNVTCTQTYSACGTTIGTFSLTKTFTHSSINGTSVTLVGVTKQ